MKKIIVILLCLIALTSFFACEKTENVPPVKESTTHGTAGKKTEPVEIPQYGKQWNDNPLSAVVPEPDFCTLSKVKTDTDTTFRPEFVDADFDSAYEYYEKIKSLGYDNNTMDTVSKKDQTIIFWGENEDGNVRVTVSYASGQFLVWVELI